MGHRLRRLFLVQSAVGFSLMSPDGAAAQVVIEGIVTNAPLLPGVPSWPNTDFGIPHTDSAGRVLFQEPGGHLALNVARLWQWEAGAFMMVVQTHDPVPNLPGVRISGGFSYNLTVSGEIYHHDNLEPYPYLEGLHVGTASGTTAFIWGASTNPPPAPGVAGATFEYFPSGAAVNAAGKVAFEATLHHDPEASDGIWAGAPGELHLVALAGDPAPGVPGYVFRYPRINRPFGAPFMNESGQVIFLAVIATPAGTDYKTGLWLGDEHGVELVACEGQPVPGAPAAVFGGWPIGGITDTGEAEFVAGLYVGSNHIGDGLFAGRPGAVRPLALPGSRVELPRGRTARFAFLQAPTFNGPGQCAGFAVLHADSGRDLTGVFLGGPDGLRAVALQTDPPPGFSKTASWSFDWYSPAYRPVLGPGGHVAWLANVGLSWGPSVPALFVTDRSGVPHLVAAVDHAVHVGPYGLWPIQINLAPYWNSEPFGAGRLNQISQDGRAAFYMSFGSSSGVFMAHADELRCIADFDYDGQVNVNDAVAFLHAFAAGELSADLDQDREVTLTDFLLFRDALASRCR